MFSLLEECGRWVLRSQGHTEGLHLVASDSGLPWHPMVLSLLDTVVPVRTDVFAGWCGAQFKRSNSGSAFSCPAIEVTATAGSSCVLPGTFQRMQTEKEACGLGPGWVNPCLVVFDTGRCPVIYSTPSPTPGY